MAASEGWETADTTFIERRLAALYRRDLPGPLRADVDARMSAAVATELSGTSPVRRPRWGRWQPLRRRASLVAATGLALFVLAGAVAASAGFFDQLLQQTPAWRVAWDRATRIGISQTVGDYRLTVERAYADADHVLIGVSVATLNGAPIAVPHDAQLRGPTGTSRAEWAGAGNDVAAAQLLFFDAPQPAGLGRVELTLTIDDVMPLPLPDASLRPPVANGGGNVVANLVPGPWEFTFDLAVAPEAVGPLVPPAPSVR